MNSIFYNDLKLFFLSKASFISFFIIYIFAAITLSTGMITPNFSTYLYFFNNAFGILIFILASRQIAYEEDKGILEIFFTSPISIWSYVLGKFFSSFVFFSFHFLLLLYFILISIPFINIPFWEVFGIFIGSFLNISFFCAIALFVSSLSKNMIFCVFFGIAFFLFFTFIAYLGMSASQASGGQLILDFSNWTHLNAFIEGRVLLKDIIFFILGDIFFLFMTKIRLEIKIWKG